MYLWQACVLRTKQVDYAEHLMGSEEKKKKKKKKKKEREREEAAAAAGVGGVSPLL